MTDGLSGGVHKTRHSTGGEDGMEIRLDLDEAVQRLEKEMDDVTIHSPRSAVAVGSRMSADIDGYDDDILPGAAQHMGSGME